MGNILTQERHIRNGTQIEDMTYRYRYDANNNLLRNRLYYINDNIASNVDSTDIDDQGVFNSDPDFIETANNYVRDKMGRLVKDRQEEIDTVIWTASNKVKEIRRNFDSNKKNIIFDYDAMGNQIAKHVYNNQTLMLEKSTYYILDAQGNQLSIYEHSVDSATNTAYYYLTDRNIYGSSRLGVTKDTINMFNPYTLQSYGVVGNRNYELTDHRGNVQTVINDIKYPLSSDNTTVDSYEVGVSSVYDYSPFGVQLDGRTIDNVFYHPESTVDTVSVTAYALEETFDIASNWQEITTETQITYPSGKMRVRNPMSNRKKIGVKNEFITGEGLHSLSFEITYLPYTLCPIIVFPGEPIFPSQTNDSILDSEEFHIQSVKNSYLVFEIFDENSISILIDSTRSVGTYSYNFTALEGENYSVLFYINSLCNTRYFEIDNVFITYEEEAIVENTNAFIATNYRYSVQNQEHHDEIRGKGNYINYKYRGYDPRVGRLDWLVDPLAKDYPWNSPYAFSENRVLDGVELEGLEWSHTWDRSNQVYGHSYTVKIKVKNSSEVVSDANLQAFLKSIKPNVEQNFTKNFQGSSMKVNIIFDFDSPIDPANDFYIDA